MSKHVIPTGIYYIFFINFFSIFIVKIDIKMIIRTNHKYVYKFAIQQFEYFVIF